MNFRSIFCVVFLLLCGCKSTSPLPNDRAVLSDGKHDYAPKDIETLKDQGQYADSEISIKAIDNPSLFEIAWDRVITKDGGSPTAALDFDGTVFTHANERWFYRFDTEAKLLVHTDISHYQGAGLGMGFLVPGPKGFGTVYRKNYGTAQDPKPYYSFGMIDSKGVIEIATKPNLTETGSGSISVVWNASLSQYIVHQEFSHVSKSHPIFQWRFNAEGKLTKEQQKIFESEYNPKFRDSALVGDHVVMIAEEGKKHPSRAYYGQHLRLWTLKPPYDAIDAMIPMFHEDELLGFSYDSSGMPKVVNGTGLFMTWIGTRGVKAALIDVINAKAITKLVTISDGKDVRAPLSATLYKGHYAVLGYIASEEETPGLYLTGNRYYITLYDTALKQVIPPTRLPFIIDSDEQKYFIGGKIFASGDDLFMIYALNYPLYTVRMMRFKLKGL